MRRRAVASIMAVLILVLATGPALAISAAVSPSYQSRAYGQTAIWGAGWGEHSPYDVTWKYGDGATWSRTNTTLVSQGFSRAFFPCPYAKTYYQNLWVKERPTGATISVNASTYVTSVSYCPEGHES